MKYTTILTTAFLMISFVVGSAAAAIPQASDIGAVGSGTCVGAYYQYDHGPFESSHCTGVYADEEGTCVGQRHGVEYRGQTVHEHKYCIIHVGSGPGAGIIDIGTAGGFLLA